MTSITTLNNIIQLQSRLQSNNQSLSIIPLYNTLSQLAVILNTTMLNAVVDPVSRIQTGSQEVHCLLVSAFLCIWRITKQLYEC